MPNINTPIEKIEGVAWRPLLEQYSLTLGAAVLIGIGGHWFAKWISRGVDRALERAHVEPLSRLFIRNLVYAILLVVTGAAVLQTLGVPPTSLIAILGAAGLGIGLALKDSLSNIAAGVLLVVQRPFHVGDIVQIAGQEGRVTQVRIFVTYLRTLDNRVVAIPNSLVTTQPIINLTNQPTRRIEIPIGVGYDDDLNLARSTLLGIANSTDGVLENPAPEVLVTNLSESSVDLMLRAWVNSGDTATVKSELIIAVRNELMAKGLNIPYPQRDLHVYHSNADGTPLNAIAASVEHDGDGDKPDVPKPAAK